MITDVLIIGGGITARIAAKTVAEQYSVTIISDGAGASPFIHGLNIPLLEDDSCELLYRDTMESGRNQGSPALVKALSYGSVHVKEKLYEHLDRCTDGSLELLKPLGSSVARVAGIEGRTGAYALKELCKNKKYTELTSVRALSLIKNKDRVVGARVFDRKREVHFSIFARAVLIATGGFGGVFRFSTNSRDIGGDGCAMAFMAGAELVDMEFIQYEPTVAVSPEPLVGKSIITTMLYEGAVMRSCRGERFMDERVGKDMLSMGIANEMARGGATPHGGVYYDMTAVPEEMLLGKYKDYFERYMRCGIDIRKEAVEVAPAPHTTMGGIRIDEKARTTVTGLFAAGEAAGGIHGANRLGGNAGLEVFVFGDIAGRAILEFLDGDDGVLLSENEETESPDVPFDSAELKEALLSVCDRALGVIKNEKDMREALGEVERIINSAVNRRDSFSWARLFNDALTVRLVLCAAIERSESIGAHIRSDARAERGEKYRISLSREENKLKLQRQTIV